MNRKLLAGIDHIVEEVELRSARLQATEGHFSVLPCTKHFFFSTDEDDINTSCMGIGQKCNKEMSSPELSHDVQKAKVSCKKQNRLSETVPELLSVIEKCGKDFANLRVALRILLTVVVSVESCERQFSKLILPKRT